jgi:predicted ATPase
MRIKSLSVDDFYILKDFKINFKNNLSVLIGENGSGKSTILELIADIFGHLHKFFILNDRDAAYVEGYQIVYDYPLFGINHTIEIHSKTKNGKYVPQIWIDKEEVSIAHIEKEYGGMSNLLPTKTILSYAGISDHLRTLSEHFEGKYKKEIIKVNNQYTLSPLNLPKERPFIYIKPEHLSMLVLSILMSDETRDVQFINDFLSIDKNNCDIVFVFKKPSWAKNNDEQWWGIKGNVATKFFETIDIYADKYLEEENTLTYGFRGTINLKYAFDELNTSRKDIAFTILDTLLYDDLLSEIDISWKLDNGDELDLNRLSEGQKQIVLTLGANYVFEEDKNLLYLLDEPDVFLHPQWQQKYVSMFQSYNKLSHVIITTHNPILIGNLQKEQIHEINNGKTVDSNNYSYGRDVNSILEDYFKVSERSSQGANLIKAFYNSMDAKDYNKAEELLNELKITLGPEDISTVKAESLFDDLAE